METAVIIIIAMLTAISSDYKSTITAESPSALTVEARSDFAGGGTCMHVFSRDDMDRFGWWPRPDNRRRD